MGFGPRVWVIRLGKAIWAFLGFSETLYFLNVLGFSGWVSIIRSRT